MYDLKSRKLFRKKFLFSIFIIAILFIIFLLHEYAFIKETKYFDSAVDKASQQRMLINQISLFSLSKITSTDKTQKKIYEHLINNNYKTLIENLKELLGANNSYGKVVTKPLQEYYLRNNKSLYLSLINKVNKIAFENHNASSNIDKTINDINNLSLNSTTIANEAVEVVRGSISRYLAIHKYFQTFYLLLLAILLIFIFFFIYKPMINALEMRESDLKKELKQNSDKAENAELNYGKYELFLNNAPVALVVLDVNTRKFIEANPKACELFKLSKENIIGKTPYEISPEFQGDELSFNAQEHHIERAIENKNHTFEWIHTDAFGEKIECIVNLTYISTKSGQYIQGSIFNITQQKLLQKELQEANEAKLKFLAVISHELKTPLNSILGYTEMLKEETKDTLSDEHLDFLLEVLKSGNHLLKLINDILEYCKVNSLDSPIAFNKANIHAIIDEVFKSMHGYIANKVIDFDINLAAKHYYFKVNESKLIHVFQNLISNAIKFTPNQGKISIETWDQDQTFYFSISNTGPGINKSMISKIFNPFVQGDEGLSRKYSGTGLGLAITKEIIELHHGSIHVESIENQKTTFTVKLPFDA